jgi:hypothetical protein
VAGAAVVVGADEAEEAEEVVAEIVAGGVAFGELPLLQELDITTSATAAVR